MVTNDDLMIHYRDFNKKFFSNKLPKDMIVEFGESKNWLGCTTYKKTRPLYIQINRRIRFSLSMCMMTLLHEMVHVNLPPRVNHGKEFQMRMLKLARQSAMKRWW